MGAEKTYHFAKAPVLFTRAGALALLTSVKIKRRHDSFRIMPSFLNLLIGVFLQFDYDLEDGVNQLQTGEDDVIDVLDIIEGSATSKR